MGADPGDSGVVEGPPDLGQAALAGELLGERRRALGILHEDAVQVAVQGARQTEPVGSLAERREVAGGILLLAEGPAGDAARRVIDPPDEGEDWSTTLEPVVATAVDLEELALAGHPFAPTAVTWRAAGPGRGDPARRQDPADGAGRQIELVGLLRERLGEVDPG